MHVSYASFLAHDVQYYNFFFRKKDPRGRYAKEGIQLTVCYYHVTYEVQSESTHYSSPECQGAPCSK